MDDWPTMLRETLAGGNPAVLVTVADTRGSAPREAGAKMIVSEAGTFGSIGGGNLEFRATGTARRLIAAGTEPRARTERMALGPGLGQCCGGDVVLVYETVGPADLSWVEHVLRARTAALQAVLITDLGAGGKRTIVGDADKPLPGHGSRSLERTVRETLDAGARTRLVKADKQGEGPFLVERLTDERSELWLFGAGHVGRALVQVLGVLPFRVIWVDSRPNEFPEALPANVTARIGRAPEDDVAQAGPRGLFLVMSHSHALDLAICEVVLRRDDFRYLGLIGSSTKKARFLRMLRESGIREAVLARLVCPIGLPGIGGKKPGEIAVAVAGQLMQVERGNHAQVDPAIPGRE